MADRVLELVKACPFDLCNPSDCPLFELRKLPSEDRQEWLKSLTRDDLVYLVSYHYICLKTKVEGRISPHPGPNPAQGACGCCDRE